MNRLEDGIISMNSIYLLLTPNCNLSCKYCFQTANPGEIPGARYHTQPGVRADRAMIERFAGFCAKNEVRHVEFFGGEPLLDRELFVFAVETIARRVPDIEFGVVTNGTLIDERIMQLFETQKVGVLLSLDGDRKRQDSMRGGFEKIRPWFSRLSQLPNITVATQAAIIPGLADEVHFIWGQGFRQVYLNIIENYDWYREEDIDRFEWEYETLIQAMLAGEGVLACALNVHAHLNQTSFEQGCGINRVGFACDWHGQIYPCHRAVELGPAFAIGDIFAGLKPDVEKKLRSRIDSEFFGSESAKRFPLASYCPVTTYQKHQTFTAPWSELWCRLIEVKAKLVAKFHYEIEEWYVGGGISTSGCVRSGAA
jgi:uncharacterized protein